MFIGFIVNPSENMKFNKNIFGQNENKNEIGIYCSHRFDIPDQIGVITHIKVNCIYAIRSNYLRKLQQIVGA